MSAGSGLRVLIDGEPLGHDEAHAFWQRFSRWMDEHVGDLLGFAQAEGLASVHPEMHAGMPVLVASRSSAQRAYTSAPKKPAPKKQEPTAAPAPRPKRR